MPPLPILLQDAWTVLSFVTFVGIVIWAFRKSSQPGFAVAAQIPFADEPPVEDADHD